MSANYTHKPINQLLPIIGRQLTSDKKFVGVQHYIVIKWLVDCAGHHTSV